MITTVTLNPAVDKTIYVEDFNIGKVNRISTMRLDAGGKGINVSKVIQGLNGESRAIGIIAGSNGDFIKNYLDSIKIENDFTRVFGETRTNIKIVDAVNHTNTDVNENGPLVSEENLNEVYSKFFKDIDNESVIVFSGSIPKNADKSIYRMWIKTAKEKGAKCLLDADGELLKQGIEAGPYLVKPNIHELEELFGQKTNSTEEVVKLSRKLFDYGIEIVVVSLGSDGALFVKKDRVAIAQGIKVDVKSTVGAGDSMVAALALAIDKGYDFEKSVRLSVACGTASVMTSGTQVADLNIIMDLEKQVEFKYLNC